VKPLELLCRAANADLILVSIASLLVAIVSAGWWTASHPAKVRALVDWVLQLSFARRYRSLLEAVAHWLQPEAALALVIVVGLLILWLSVWVFGSLEHVIAQEETALFDAPVLSFVARHRVAWVTKTMEIVTLGGGKLLLVLSTIALGIWLCYRTHSWQALLLLATSVLGAMLLESVAMQLIARPHPLSAWIAVRTGGGFAFPSGHSVRSVAAYGAFAYLSARTQSVWERKVVSLTLGTLIAFLIGTSRVYLGVHRPTDVIAGWALGSAWLVIVFTAYSTIMETDIFDATRTRSEALKTDKRRGRP
jgi:undecaprenyl-diphosphatase